MLRVFSDGNGRTWRVWAVAPGAVIGRRAGERRREAAPDPVIERRRQPDRRRVSRGGLLGVAPALVTGWLAFETDPPQHAPTRLRLAPIPDDWEGCPDGALRGYLDRAERGAAGVRRDD